MQLKTIEDCKRDKFENYNTSRSSTRHKQQDVDSVTGIKCICLGSYYNYELGRECLINSKRPK